MRGMVLKMMKMNDLRERFTKWYYRKGYRVVYNDPGPGFKGIELIFYCPWWVRPLVRILWTPSVYFREVGIDYAEGFLKGFTRKF